MIVIAGLTLNEAIAVLVLSFAVIVAVMGMAETEDGAANVVEFCPAGIKTDDGTVTTALSELSDTVAPPADAGWARVILPVLALPASTFPDAI